MNPAPQRHYVALDAFRFIAALGIVLHHCAIYADAMGWQSHVTMFDNFRLCVDFFFALSGFVPMHVHGSAITSGSDYLRFLQKRLARISWTWIYGAGIGLIALMLSPASAALSIAIFPLFIGLVALAERGGAPTLLTRAPFPRLGDASYSVYLLHALMMLLAAEAINATGATGLAAFLALTAATIALTIPLALITFRFYETPMRRRLSPAHSGSYRLRPAASRRSIASE